MGTTQRADGCGAKGTDGVEGGDSVEGTGGTKGSGGAEGGGGSGVLGVCQKWFVLGGGSDCWAHGERIRAAV
jgi:hypothetical protein